MSKLVQLILADRARRRALDLLAAAHRDLDKARRDLEMVARELSTGSAR